MTMSLTRPEPVTQSEPVAPPSAPTPSNSVAQASPPTLQPRVEAQVAELERRIAKLERQNNATRGTNGAWLGPTIGSTITSVVALVGFWAVHRFAVKRQERDEFYKRVQDCVAVIDKAALAAAGFWRTKAHARKEEARLEIQDAMTDIAQRLAFLNRLEPNFDVGTSFTDFKRTATLDIEEGDSDVDPKRADAARRTGRRLTHAMSAAFDKTFYKKRRV